MEKERDSLDQCPECGGKGEVSATPGQPGDGPMPCPRCTPSTPPRGLPWRVDDYQPWCVFAADGRLVAYAGPLPPDPNPVRAELDAAKIVEAVNAYFGADTDV